MSRKDTDSVRDIFLLCQRYILQSTCYLTILQYLSAYWMRIHLPSPTESPTGEEIYFAFDVTITLRAWTLQWSIKWSTSLSIKKSHFPTESKANRKYVTSIWKFLIFRLKHFSTENAIMKTWQRLWIVANRNSWIINSIVLNEDGKRPSYNNLLVIVQ